MQKADDTRPSSLFSKASLLSGHNENFHHDLSPLLLIATVANDISNLQEGRGLKRKPEAAQLYENDDDNSSTETHIKKTVERAIDLCSTSVPTTRANSPAQVHSKLIAPVENRHTCTKSKTQTATITPQIQERAQSSNERAQTFTAINQTDLNENHVQRTVSGNQYLDKTRETVISKADVKEKPKKTDTASQCESRPKKLKTDPRSQAHSKSVNKAESAKTVSKTENVKSVNKPDNVKHTSKTESVKTVSKTELGKPVSKVDNIKAAGKADTVNIKTESVKAENKTETGKPIIKVENNKATGKTDTINIKAGSKAETVKTVSKSEHNAKVQSSKAGKEVVKDTGLALKKHDRSSDKRTEKLSDKTSKQENSNEKNVEKSHEKKTLQVVEKKQDKIIDKNNVDEKNATPVVQETTAIKPETNHVSEKPGKTEKVVLNKNEKNGESEREKKVVFEKKVSEKTITEGQVEAQKDKLATNKVTNVSVKTKDGIKPPQLNGHSTPAEIAKSDKQKVLCQSPSSH